MIPEEIAELITACPAIDNIFRSMNGRVGIDVQNDIYYGLVVEVTDKKQGFDFHVYRRIACFFMKDE